MALTSLRTFTATAALAAFVLITPTANAQTLAATTETHGAGFGYGDYRYVNFSAELDARFDDVVIIPDLTDLGLMLEHDALMIQLRIQGSVLSATEQTNLADYIDTGRRVLFMGENSGWISWNNSFLSVVGGSWVREIDGVYDVVNEYSPLTDGVTTVHCPNGGSTTGGLSLFEVNFATVWPGDGSENAFSMLDVNAFEDSRWDTYDGGTYATNVAEWLATGGGGGGFTLSSEGDCPGTMTLTTTGGTPNGFVGFIYSFQLGPWIMQEPCMGVELGIVSPTVLEIVRADDSGNASVTGNAPPSVCGRVYLQAVDAGACTASNVIGL